MGEYWGDDDEDGRGDAATTKHKDCDEGAYYYNGPEEKKTGSTMHTATATAASPSSITSTAPPCEPSRLPPSFRRRRKKRWVRWSMVVVGVVMLVFAVLVGVYMSIVKQSPGKWG